MEAKKREFSEIRFVYQPWKSEALIEFSKTSLVKS